MKKRRLLIILIPILVIVGVLTFVLYNNAQNNNNNNIVRHFASESYGVDISYFGEDTISVTGEYDQKTGKLTYENDKGDNNEYSINLYEKFTSYLPENVEENSTTTLSLSSSDILGNLRFMRIRSKSSVMNCEYSIVNSAITHINCKSDVDDFEVLTIDFSFD